MYELLQQIMTNGTRVALWLTDGRVVRCKIVDVRKTYCVATEVSDVTAYTAAAVTTQITWAVGLKHFIALGEIARGAATTWA